MASRAIKTARRGPTLAQIRQWPATTDVGTAGSALGYGRSASYEAVRTGRFPVKTIRVGHRIRVLTADLLRVLEGGDHAEAG
jgi:hypothetical protein